MADINVLMMGGRRAGKTSILAAMDRCCKEILSTDELLRVVCQAGSVEVMLKITELSDYFTDPRYTKSCKFVPDVNPTGSANTFEYECKVKGRPSGFTLRFTDVPGEYYEEPDKRSDMEDMVRKSQVLMIAVDSPHLMESTGDKSESVNGYCCYHESYNRVAEITDFFKTAFQNNEDIRTQNKLVIFVPLKCEKYYFRQEMERLHDMIKKGYEDLFRILSSPGINEICTVAIMPILTIGGAEFFKFKKYSYVGEYNYVENAAFRAYLPKYCEQPLFLTLQYVISLARRKAEGRFPLFRMFSELFGNQAKLEDLKTCEHDIKSKIMRDPALGFDIVQDPVKMIE
ncbi:MAG: hypothetical protein LUK37_02400 [Clostridia bacterium]|nr:hypothetical protein [Clostridia bacterium]